MQKILDEIREMAEKNVGFPADKVLAHARSNAQEAMESDNDYARGLCVMAAGLLVVALQNIDAEAESAQFREQARALLVLGHQMGEERIYLNQADRFSFYPAEDSNGWMPTSAEPTHDQIETIARALRARKAKP